jgi:hypothetical protein
MANPYLYLSGDIYATHLYNDGSGYDTTEVDRVNTWTIHMEFVDGLANGFIEVYTNTYENGIEVKRNIGTYSAKLDEADMTVVLTMNIYSQTNIPELYGENPKGDTDDDTTAKYPYSILVDNIYQPIKGSVTKTLSVNYIYDSGYIQLSSYPFTDIYYMDEEVSYACKNASGYGFVRVAGMEYGEGLYSQASVGNFVDTTNEVTIPDTDNEFSKIIYTLRNSTPDWYIDTNDWTLYIDGIERFTVNVSYDIGNIILINKVDFVSAVAKSNGLVVGYDISNNGDIASQDEELSISMKDWNPYEYRIGTVIWGKSLKTTCQYCGLSLLPQASETTVNYVIPTVPIPSVEEYNIPGFYGIKPKPIYTAYEDLSPLYNPIFKEHYYSCGWLFLRGGICFTIFQMKYAPIFINPVDGITTIEEYLRHLQSISVIDIEDSKQVWIDNHDDIGAELYEDTRKFKTYMDYYFETSKVYKEYLNIFNMIIMVYFEIANKSNNPSAVFFDRGVILGTNEKIQPKLCYADLKDGFPVGGTEEYCFVDFSKVRSKETIPYSTFTANLFQFQQSILIPLFNKRSDKLIRSGEHSKELVRSAISVTENKTEEDEKSLVRKA